MAMMFTWMAAFWVTYPPMLCGKWVRMWSSPYTSKSPRATLPKFNLCSACSDAPWKSSFMRTNFEVLPVRDLVVNVDLKAFTAIQYNQAGRIMDRGSEAAAAKANILAPYELDDAAWSAYLDHRAERLKTEVPVPQFVEVRGTNPKSSEEVARFLQPLKGKPINVPAMERASTS